MIPANAMTGMIFLRGMPRQMALSLQGQIHPALACNNQVRFLQF
jgi:hypothetical protein